MPNELVEQKDLQNLEIPEAEMLAFESEEAYEASLTDEKKPEPPPEEPPKEPTEPAVEAKEKPPTEPAPLPEKPGEEELTLEYDGKKYDEEYLTEAVKERQDREKLEKNLVDFRKKNTERAQQLSKIRKGIEVVKSELLDEELLEELDERYGSKTDNPFRGLDLTASLEPELPEEPAKESKSEFDKRLDVLEQEKVERDQAKADADMQAKAHVQVEREVTSLIELDPKLEKDSDKLQKIAERALAMTEENPDDPPVRLVDAWLDLYGKKQLGLKGLKEKAKDTNETVGGPGARTTIPKTPAKDRHEAAQNALEEYLSMGE